MVKIFGYLVEILFWLCWIGLLVACVLVKIFVLVTCIGLLVECVLVKIFRFGLFCTVKHFGQGLVGIGLYTVKH